MSRSVIIRRCVTLAEAYICWGLLRANSFDASIDNAHHAAQDWSIIPALGGVAVRVPLSQYQTAKACIVDIATSADDLLAQEFGDYEPPVRRRRIAIWSMILIYIGVFQFVSAYIFVFLLPLIPADWLPTSQHHGAMVDWNIGFSAASLESGVNGLVFMFVLILFLGHELLHSTPSKPPKEPSV